MADRDPGYERDIEDWSADEDGSKNLRRLSIRRPRRRMGLRRACLVVASAGASALFLVLLALTLVSAMLWRGPIALDLAPQIVAALNQRVGHGYAFDVGSTSLEMTALGPALTLNRLAVSDAAHHPVITSQKAAISVDPLALLTGKISPRQLEIHDVDLRLIVLASGEVAISAGAGTSAIPLAKAFVANDAADHAPTIAEHSGSGGATDHAPGTQASADDPPRGNAALRALAATMRTLVDTTTSPDSAFSALDTVHITGRMVLDDQSRGTKTVFTNAQISFDKPKDGSALLEVAADGSTGRWTLTAQAERADDNVKMLTMDVKNLSLDLVTLAGGLRDLGFDFNMPISATASVRIGADGVLDRASGQFAFGTGYFKLDDPDHEPLFIDAMSGGFHLDPTTRGVVIDKTRLQAGGSDFVMTGRIELPAAPSAAWKITTDASGTFGTERPGELPIKIAHAGMGFRLLPSERRFVIDRVDVEGPEVAFQSSGEVRIEADGFRLANTSSIKNMPAKALSRLWPSFIAAPVRAWFLANLHGGTVVSGKSVVNLTDRDLVLMRAQRAVPDSHVRVDYAVSDLSLDVMPGVPPLTTIAGTGIVTGTTSRFSVSHAEMEVAPGRKLTLVQGVFDVPNTDPKPTPAIIDARITGNVDAVADLLARDALKPYADVPIDGAAYKGQVDAHLNIALPLGDHVLPDDIKTSVTATAINFTADKLIGKEGLVDTNLQLVADRTGIRAKGDGRMYGAPASIELKKPAGGAPGEAVINLTMDDAARARAGMTFGRTLTGVILAHITTPLTSGDRKQGAVELDFTKTAIDGIVPGFTKPSGKPGKATLTVTQRDGGGASLDNIVFEGGGVSLRGAAEVDGTGDLTSARMSQVRLSPGDDMKVDARQSADGLRLTVRGASVDARPFLKWLTAPGQSTPRDLGERAKLLDVDFHANVLTGQNKQAMTNVDLRFSRRGNQMRSLQMSGRFGRAPLTISTLQQGTGPVIAIKSGDAGETLAFMDLYKRMLNGRLEANIAVGENKMDGSFTVHDFTLREDPAIKQLATEGLATQNRGNDTARFDPGAVSFTKLAASFTKAGDTVTVRDGIFFGPAVGATVEGTMDLAQDAVNLEGTFVPLYGVNNLFSQIPLFGPLLGGGAHEGLFGINYRITGPAAAPVLSVNPLSAMAPGFLRKIFGALDTAAQGAIDPRDHAPPPVRAVPVAPPEPDGGLFAQ